jgi:hypothetical protein
LQVLLKVVLPASTPWIVLVLMAVVTLVNWLLDRTEAHLLRWRPASPDTARTQG